MAVFAAVRFTEKPITSSAHIAVVMAGVQHQKYGSQARNRKKHS